MRARGSKNTNKIIKDIPKEANLEKDQQNVLGKILVTLCEGRKITADKDSEDTNLPSVSREQKLKEVGCGSRVKRVTQCKAKKKIKERDNPLCIKCTATT